VRRLHSLAVYLFTVALVTSMLAVYLFLPNLKFISNLFDEEPGSKLLLQSIASCIYTFSFAALFPVQVYFYLRFAQANRKSYTKLTGTDSNSPLRFLVKNAWICCVTFTLNLLYFLFLLGTDAWMK